jgi:hypothetical protein
MAAVIASFGLIPGLFIIFAVHAACFKGGQKIDQIAKQNRQLEHLQSTKFERLYK